MAGEGVLLRMAGEGGEGGAPQNYRGGGAPEWRGRGGEGGRMIFVLGYFVEYAA